MAPLLRPAIIIVLSLFALLGRAQADSHFHQFICWALSNGNFQSTYQGYSNTINYNITILTNQYTHSGLHDVTVYNTDVSPPLPVKYLIFRVNGDGTVSSYNSTEDSSGSYTTVVGTYTVGGNNFPYSAGSLNYQFPPTTAHTKMILDEPPVGPPAPNTVINFTFQSDFTYQHWYLTHGGIFSFLGEEGPYIDGTNTGTATNQPVFFDLRSQPPNQPKYCASCGCSKNMPTAQLDHYSAEVSITDTPVGYTPPVGYAMNFTLTYRHRTQSQPATFNYSNLGPVWNSSWITYISGGPTGGESSVSATQTQPDGTQMVYGGYKQVAVQGDNVAIDLDGDFVDNQAYTLATLHFRNNPVVHYELWNPDGSKEIFGQAIGTIPNQQFFLTAMVDPHGNTTTLVYDPTAASNGQALLTQVTDPYGNSLSFTYGLSSDPLKITAVSRSYDGLTAHIGYTNGQLTNLTDTIGISSSFTYSSGTNFIQSMTTPYGTTTFNSQDSANIMEADMTNPLGQNERVEFATSLDPSLYAAEDTSVPSAPGFSAINLGLNQNASFYWDRRAMDQARNTGQAIDSAGFYQLATVTQFGLGEQGPLPVAIATKKPLESRVWMNYQGQPAPNVIQLSNLGAMTSVSAQARLLDDGTTQATFTSYNANGNVINMIDPVGRTTLYTYSPNPEISPVERRKADVWLCKCFNWSILRNNEDPKHRPNGGSRM